MSFVTDSVAATAELANMSDNNKSISNQNITQQQQTSSSNNNNNNNNNNYQRASNNNNNQGNESRLDRSSSSFSSGHNNNGNGRNNNNYGGRGGRGRSKQQQPQNGAAGSGSLQYRRSQGGPADDSGGQPPASYFKSGGGGRHGGGYGRNTKSGNQIAESLYDESLVVTNNWTPKDGRERGGGGRSSGRGGGSYYNRGGGGKKHSNAYYNPQRITAGRQRMNSRGNDNGLSHGKEQYLKANCQFLVHASVDTSVYMIHPDLPVEWDVIEELWSTSLEETKCPICLYPPVAGKMTKCGHVYCWPCILHYLSLSDHEWRKCPICYESIYPKQLKSFVDIRSNAHKLGSDVRLFLIKRDKQTAELTFPPSSSNGGIELLTKEEKNRKDMKFAKFVHLSNEEILSKIVEREKSALEVALTIEAGTPEICFIHQALEDEWSQRNSDRRRKQYEERRREIHFEQWEKAVLMKPDIINEMKLSMSEMGNNDGNPEIPTIRYEASAQSTVGQEQSSSEPPDIDILALWDEDVDPAGAASTSAKINSNNNSNHHQHNSAGKDDQQDFPSFAQMLRAGKPKSIPFMPPSPSSRTSPNQPSPKFGATEAVDDDGPGLPAPSFQSAFQNAIASALDGMDAEIEGSSTVSTPSGGGKKKKKKTKQKLLFST